MPLILPGNVASATAATTFSVDNSCRFNDGDAVQLYRDITSAGNRRTWTVSWWMKIGAMQAGCRVWSQGNTPSQDPFTGVELGASGALTIFHYDGSYPFIFEPSIKLRDPSAWYHLVLSFDSTPSTPSSSSIKFFVNGVQQTAFSTETYPSQNLDTEVNNSTYDFYVGAYDGGNYFDGYLSEFCLIDGTAYNASTFGEYDEDSPTIWKPKDFSGDVTFGTNGFYLDFQDSSALGNDVSGNDNDLTATNLDATDQATDTPTNNFCTWNPLIHAATTGTFSEGNCKISPASNTSRIYTASTLAMPTKAGSKWYAEFKIDADNEGSLVGVMDASFIGDAFNSNPDIDSPTTRTDLGRVVYRISTGDINYPSGQVISTGVTSADNDIISVALDAGGGLVYFAKNGTWLNSADPAAGSNGADVTGQGWWTTGVDEFVFICGDGSVNAFDNWEAHFGGCPSFAISSANADDAGYGNFEYDVPAGFYALCTKNLAEYG